MSDARVKLFGSSVEFANFGKSAIAYVRKVKTEDLIEDFSETGLTESHEHIWALFGADGTAISIADERSALAIDAEEMDLLTVLRH